MIRPTPTWEITARRFVRHERGITGLPTAFHATRFAGRIHVLHFRVFA